MAAELVLAINGLGAIHRKPILASMYRHLAHWPAYLALVWTALAPLDFDHRLDRAIEAAIAQARARAQCLAAELPTPLPAIRLLTARRVTRAIDRFTGDAIARMVVICSLLRRLTDSSALIAGVRRCQIVSSRGPIPVEELRFFNPRVLRVCDGSLAFARE
jgi:hypothetical protein